jgi:NitT/TauT family transport system substrate-binding protein
LVEVLHVSKQRGVPATVVTQISTAEVVRGIFYAPVYVALAMNVYEAEGLAVRLTTLDFGAGEDYLRSGAADLIVAAPMRTMRQFEATGERIISIAPVVIRHPWYLFGASSNHFVWSDLRGKRVIDFAEAETPILALRHVLRQHGIGDSDVEIVEGLTTPGAVAAFRRGEADYLLHTLHTGEALLADGIARVAQPLAPEVGRVPFTAFATLATTLEQRRDDIGRFVRAFARALKWIGARPASEVASALSPFFPGHDLALMKRSVASYQELGIWPSSTKMPVSDFNRFRDILVATGWLRGSVTYEAVTEQIT